MANLEDILKIPGVKVETEDQTITIPMDSIIPEDETPKLKNVEMEQMLSILEKHLERTDIIGYAAARNTRILQSETHEYFERRNALVEKYGEPQLDEDGKPTGMTELAYDSPNFAKFLEELEQWAVIEHQPVFFKIPIEEAIGKISGSELLEIEWMFED